MDLSAAEVGYFIEQVAMSAASFGVAQDDLMVVGKALTSTFDVKCAAPATVVKSQGPQLQSICIDETCPMAPNGTCAMYNATMKPAVANATLAGNSTPSSTGKPGASSSMPAGTTKSGAVAISMSFAAVFGGLAAMFL